MKLWPRDYSLEELNRLNNGNLLGHLGIEFVNIDSESLTARMPVDARTTQPFGLLHGGASVALAESVASFAAFLTLRDQNKTTVGLEVNANHLRPVTAGFVYGVARPLHLGRNTQVWDIRISDDQARLVCVARLTVAVVPRPTKHHDRMTTAASPESSTQDEHLG
jgi:1,4-dihydroxy-2-naphthoyl-CoA hydrolase